MKTYPARSTCTQFWKRSLLRIGALKHFDHCSVVWDGLSRQLSEKVKKLQNTRAARVVTKSTYDTNSRSTRLSGINYQLQGRSKRQISCANTSISQPQFIFVTCSLQELCPLIFATQGKNCIYRNQDMTTWNTASITAELLYGKIFQRNFALQVL